MKLLVTGGAGFVGVNFIDFVRCLGNHRIVVLENFSLGKREHLDGFDVDIIEGDIRDSEAVRQALDGADSVVHLAAHTRVIESIADPTLNFDVNVRGTYCLLEAVRDAGVKSFVLASTAGAILGHVKPPVDEDIPPRPISPYGASKLAGEAYCSAFASCYGLHTIALRFSNVYGPRSYHKGSVVAHFFKQILKREPLTVYGDGSQTRDFVYVGDLCGAIWNTITQGRPGGCYQLGTGKPTSINRLVELIRDVVGPEYPFEVIYEDFRPGEIKHTYANIARAKAEISYAPATELATGLQETWAWLSDAHERFAAPNAAGVGARS